MIHGQLDKDNRLWVDNSILSTLSTCTTKVIVRYGWGKTSLEENKYLRAGSAAHLVLEQFLHGKPLDECVRVGDVAYRLWSEANIPPDDRLAWPNVRRILTAWMQAKPLDSLPFEVDTHAPETPFTVPLVADETIMFTFRPDVPRVRARVSGLLGVVDHKTTGRITDEWRRGWSTAAQLSGYLWGMQKVSGEPYTHAYVNAIELSRIPTSTRKCKDHGVPYSECSDLHIKFEMLPVTRSQEQIDAWHLNAVHLASRYRDSLIRYGGMTKSAITMMPQEGSFTGSCAYCQLNDWCRIGRPLEALESFEHKPWDPTVRL